MAVMAFAFLRCRFALKRFIFGSKENTTNFFGKEVDKVERVNGRKEGGGKEVAVQGFVEVCECCEPWLTKWSSPPCRYVTMSPCRHVTMSPGYANNRAIPPHPDSINNTGINSNEMKKHRL